MNGRRTVQVKAPSKCSSAELSIFCSWVREGGQVIDGLDARVRKLGKALAFISSENGTLAAVGALKQPNPTYRRDVFEKARCKNRCVEFGVELGWCFVAPAFRGKGLSNDLVEVLVAAASEHEKIFATSESNNVAMHKALQRHGFEVSGGPIRSIRGSYTLKLFLLER